jgi:hypothetical protein
MSGFRRGENVPVVHGSKKEIVSSGFIGDQLT